MQRRAIRSSLTEWARLAGFEPARHHGLLIRELEAITRGENDRLAIFMPPGSAKSTYASRLFPPWFLAQNPTKSVIAASHTAELAEKWGRSVRNLVQEHAQSLGFGIAKDNQAAGRWATNKGGEYLASGVGGAIAGFRADLGLIDDPVRSREDADSELIRERTWEWYRTDFYTRLKPGAAIVLVQCMAGDTLVMLEDGTHKELRSIRVGDRVATYEDGRLSASSVVNWANQGPDKTYAIKTSSGTIVRANARHPFLVVADGSTEWKRVADLRIGDKVLRATGVSGEEFCVPLTAATSRRDAGDFATVTTTSIFGQADIGLRLSMQSHDTRRESNAGTESTKKNLTGCLQSRADVAPFAASLRVKTSAPIGAESCALTIAMTPESQEGCYATTATLQLDTSKIQQSLSEPQNICDFTTDRIVEIVEAGIEDVFDIQVERTENFIANGLVSHNTRWHEDDLAGRILASEGDKRDGGQWRVISLPAIAMERDPLGRAPGEALWPEWEPIDHLERKRTVVGPRAWLSLYQQSPTAEEGTYFQRDWWRYYDALPRDLNIYMSGDFAVTDSGGDYTELAVWGVDPTGDLYALDWWSGQETADVWCDALLDRVDRWKPLRFIGETGPIRRAVEPFLDRRMRERRVYTATEWIPTSNGSKEARARPFQAMTATGRVFWPRKEWAERVLDQCLRFPAGKHDDAVDTCALIGAYLDKTWAATRTPEPKPAVIADRFVAGDFFQPPKAASW